MACFHPLEAWKPKVTNSYDDKSLLFLPHDTPSPGNVLIYKGKEYHEKVKVPCGRCIGCRIDYSKQWAQRCMLEAKMHKYNYFVTLTYSPENIEKCLNVFNRFDMDTGEFLCVDSSYTLVRKHLQKFMKDLRRHFKYHFNYVGIRFFASGEYGAENGRPHFHVILFNCPLDLLGDLKFYKTTFNGDTLFTSEILSNDIWKNGFAVIGEVTSESCAYTARYMLKKFKGAESDAFYASKGLEPEFSVMSRMPGIAREYYDILHDKIYTYDEIVLTNRKNEPIRCRPSRYYDRLFAEHEPCWFDDVKQRRSFIGEIHNKDILSRTDLNEKEYLKVSESKFIDKIKKLKRSL